MLISAIYIGRRQAASLFYVSPSIFSSSTSQKRTIYSKYAVPEYAKHKPAPWPYREKGFYFWDRIRDFGVSKRFDENSKLIIVEGNVGCGKSKVAKELADRLGFHHIPDPPFDDLFIDSYGDDRRLYYHLLPETCRKFDTRMFLEQPRHRNVALFQKERFLCRVEAYLNALAHILNTGQGVVMERTFHTDRVFVEAMHQKGYLSDVFRYHYHKFLRKYIESEIKLEAHLVVYLDCPVSKCMENLKKYHKPWEWQNEVMDYTYLENIEKGLKAWLKEYSRHAEIMMYDWSEGGDAEKIAEDIEEMDLDSFYGLTSEKFETWNIIPHELDFTEYRHIVTSDKWKILFYFDVPEPKCEELILPIDDRKIAIAIHNLIYGHYQAGYRKDRGDSVYDMVMTWFARDLFTNKKWTEYWIQDVHHCYDHGLSFYHPGTQYARLYSPSFPEDFMLPRSPYKSDGGCMAHAQLFLDESGHLVGVH